MSLPILLVEDDLTLGVTLKERLEKEGYLVSWAKSKAEAKGLAENQEFVLYILDVGLPDGTGFELVDVIPRRPFIFLTAQGDAQTRLSGYERGAEEFIPKPFHLRELLLRIRHVLEDHAPAFVLIDGLLKVNFDSFEWEYGGQKEVVAAKDILLLKLLVKNSPNVVSRDEALNSLWGEDKFPSNRTVDNSVLRLRSALKDLSHRIQSIRGVGYKWNPNSKFGEENHE